MTVTKVFIHVGMHKTGTSFLQNEVFPNIPNICYSGKVDLTTHVEENRINLFSDENLDGGSYRLFNSWHDRYHIANNLKKMFPDAGIIICLRDEKTWVVSAWKQYVLSYFGHSFVEYFERTSRESLDFIRYATYLQHLFTNVLVLRYEDLQKDPERFVSSICDFMGVPHPAFVNRPVYQSLTNNQAFFIIIFDHIFRSKTLHLILSVFIRFIRKDPTITRFMEKKL
jgi:hypothetical protein